MKRGIVLVLCVTGLAAIALLGSRAIASRRREGDARMEAAEDWYEYMQA